MMRFRVIASDFDGTLASNEHVDQKTLETLVRVRESGRKLILITGRVLDDLRGVFRALDLFDLVIAENGALAYWPSPGAETALAKPSPALFVERLREAGVKPISQGRSLVATVRPYEDIVAKVIRELKLDLQIIFNREAVMVLPDGVDKATGLAYALNEFHAPSDAVVGVGDAENDWAFLSRCGLSVAVANAIPSLKKQVHVVTSKPEGAGVVEMLQKLMAENLP